SLPERVVFTAKTGVDQAKGDEPLGVVGVPAPSFIHFGASNRESGAGNGRIAAKLRSHGLEVGARQPNAPNADPLSRNGGKRERQAAVIALAQGDIQPSLGEGCGSRRVFSNNGLDGRMNGFWISTPCEIDRCSRHPCLRVKRNEFEGLIQNCSEISITALVFIGEGQLLEQEDVARVQLQGALKIACGFLPPPLPSINKTS